MGKKNWGVGLVLWFCGDDQVPGRNQKQFFGGQKGGRGAFETSCSQVAVEC